MTDSTLHTPEAETSLPVKITLPEAKELLARAVQEKGEDYTYSTIDGDCLYFNPATGCPSCKVGHVLAYKGVTLEALDLAEANNSTDVHDLVASRIIEVDLETEYLLTLAQSYQDEGATWGRSLKMALEGYKGAAEDAVECASAYSSSGDEDYPF